MTSCFSSGDNAGSQGQWIFQIGGIMFNNDEASKESEKHHVKKTRQSGFQVSEVNCKIILWIFFYANR